jgi:hypothetical protein
MALQYPQIESVVLSNSTKVVTYYADASISGPTDTNSAWLQDADAFDGSESTYASNDSNVGSYGVNDLVAEGTSAVAGGGGRIVSVRARFYGGTPTTSQISCQISANGSSIGTIVKADGLTGWSGWVDLSDPIGGGWDSSVLSDLEVALWVDVLGSSNRVYKIEFEVTTSSALTLQCAPPSGIVAGSLLILKVGTNNSSVNVTTLSIDDGAFPDWIRLAEAGGSASSSHMAFWWKIADGTEGNVDVVSTHEADMLGWYIRVSGHSNSDPIDIYQAQPRGNDSEGYLSDSGDQLRHNDYSLGIGAFVVGGGDIIPLGAPTGGWTAPAGYEQSAGLADEFGVYGSLGYQEFEFKGALVPDGTRSYTTNLAGSVSVTLIINPSFTIIEAEAQTDHREIQYPVINWDTNLGLSDTTFGQFQTFTGDGHILLDSAFWLSKTGTPPGSAISKLYAHQGTFGVNGKPVGAALATSESIVADTLPTTQGRVNFNFTDGYRLEDGTPYCIAIEYELGDASNRINIGIDNSSPTHEGNYGWQTAAYVWTGSASRATIFYITTRGAGAYVYGV